MTALNITDEDLLKLKGKVTILTGGSAGIGLATSKLFSANGAILYIGDLRPPPPSVLLPGSTFLKTDVTRWEDLLSLFHRAWEDHGRIDIVLPNAGVGEIEDMFADTLDADGKLERPKYKVLDINLGGVLDCVKIAVYHMKKQQEGGSIVMTGSTASYLGEPIPQYTTAKHGLLGLMRATKKNLLKHGITINLVCPWMTESNLMFDSLREALIKHHIPINDPTSIGKALAYSAVSGQDWTGRTIYVADNTFTEIESKVQELEPGWLGEKNAREFREAEKVDYFGDDQPQPGNWTE
ncbi:short chain dehydrogenase/ reductase [Dacryopinax primogenitus]|uniref:Short chain dehydrogenase/ reductase n=1 Tax=Dacryopinax primogenitus (strain DJM 731) TaxID=1858805 RepID=M5G2R6_DACPD|nr:short chain dehydrogenase/ reductase [Dacryopinax primogenitus]EJU00137.1 short chain dehydrogenase/ reductase [Dacryopinax primogenitus]